METTIEIYDTLKGNTMQYPTIQCNTTSSVKHTPIFSSLVFERGYGWNGLLVEPHPVIFAKVLNCTALKNLIARKSAGAASAEEGLECGFMSSHSHKVSFFNF